MFHGIDLSSDTATKPSQAMKMSMINAEVGDEQKDEDPTTNQLQAMVADLLGFSYAIFLPSATMANQIAIGALTNPGEEVIAAENSHIFTSESGGPAIHSGVMLKPIHSKTGIFSTEEVIKSYRPKTTPHRTFTSCISIENTTNIGGGVPWSSAELQHIILCADELNLKKHMDGARFFNACVATNTSPRDMAHGFDMITICLSKGLGCPVGALLIFNAPYYERVKYLKHLMGGAMRQSGMLAAAGVYALKNNITRLADDHENAKELARKLEEMSPSIEVKNSPPESNIVLFEWSRQQPSAEEFHRKCREGGVRFSQVSSTIFRAVTHLDVSKNDIHSAIEIIKKIV